MQKTVISSILITISVTLAILFYMGWSSYSNSMRVNASCQSSTANTSFPSRSDKLDIAARHTVIEDAQITVILIHGLDECKDDPRLVATERAYHAMGHSTLAIDMRSHGQSENGGQFHGFGSLRSDDILGAFDWLNMQDLPNEQIVLHGQSLGGSAALFAALREPRIARVVAEDPILNFDAIVRDGGSPSWFVPIYKAAGRLRGFDLSQQPVAVCETGRADQEILILHVTEDPVTPISQLDFVPEEGAICSTLRIDGDWHIGWALQQPEAFRTMLVDWLKRTSR